jgi:hypothetical protein
MVPRSVSVWEVAACGKYRPRRGIRVTRVEIKAIDPRSRSRARWKGSAGRCGSAGRRIPPHLLFVLPVMLPGNRARALRHAPARIGLPAASDADRQADGEQHAERELQAAGLAERDDQR